jgi:hypothetical protein
MNEKTGTIHWENDTGKGKTEGLAVEPLPLAIKFHTD